MTMAVPSIGYATGLGYALMEGGAELANEVFKQKQASSMVTLFCGITNHSQALSPILALSAGWVLCDMLLIERRFRWLHLLLIVLVLPLTYKSRSRVGLVSNIAAFVMCGFYAARKVQLPSRVKAHLNNGIFMGVSLLLIVGVISQIRGGAMSEWIRKTGDVEGDKRSLSEALASSRIGLIDQSLYEFRRNPLFGSGFQVAEYTPERVKRNKGLILSSPIEKGVAPVMVLGETGILGEFCFILFLASFYGTCISRKYIVTNMAEATLFSPGGIGGILWMISAVGGFSLDTYLLYRRQVEQQWSAIGFQMAPAFEIVEDASGRKRMVESRRYGG